MSSRVDNLISRLEVTRDRAQLDLELFSQFGVLTSVGFVDGHQQMQESLRRLVANCDELIDRAVAGKTQGAST